MPLAKASISVATGLFRLGLNFTSIFLPANKVSTGAKGIFTLGVAGPVRVAEGTVGQLHHFPERRVVHVRQVRRDAQPRHLRQ